MLLQDTNVGPILPISKAPEVKNLEKTQWAEEVDISKPVTDFDKKVPNPAFSYKFELDTFQKQVRWKLFTFQTLCQ